MDLDRFPCLTYFLSNYWHEMSDEIYGDLENAVAAFMQESEKLRKGLLDDLTRAEGAGMFARSFDDPVYETPFWSKFDRMISSEEAAIIKQIMKSDEIMNS